MMSQIRSPKSSQLFDIISRMYEKIQEHDVKPKKLAMIIGFAVESRIGLLIPNETDDDPDWVEPAIEDYTEMIVRANHKAHKIINGDLVPDDVEEQVLSALSEIPSLKDTYKDHTA